MSVEITVKNKRIVVPESVANYVHELEQKTTSAEKSALNTLLATGIELEVIKDIESRQQLGIKKYGQTVDDNPLTLKQWLQHAYEEHLDACIYLKKAIKELG